MSPNINPSLRFTLLLVFLLTGSLTDAQSIKRTRHFGKNPGSLKMFLYLPSSVSPDDSLPLVVVLHGCTQNAEKVAEQSGWNKLAELHHFAVLYPQQRRRNNPMRCYCWYRRWNINKGRGENFSIKQMVDYTLSNNKIDSSQIFVTELSAGAAMAVVMLTNYPETFKAGAIFAGGPYRSATNGVNAVLSMFGWRNKRPEKWAAYVRKQNPEHTGNYPQVIIYQGQRDLICNKRNGIELMKQWTGVYGTDAVPDETITGYKGVREMTREVYRDKTGKEVVLFYKVEKLGHALLVNPGNEANEGGCTGVFARNKGYHSTYWTAVDFGLIPMPTSVDLPILKKDGK